MKECIYNYFERLKNKEIKVNIHLLLLTWGIITVISFYSVLYVTNLQLLLKTDIVGFVALMIIMLFDLFLGTTLLYILTPRTLTYKAAIVINIYLVITMGLIHLLYIPAHFILKENAHYIVNIIKSVVNISLVCVIKKVYCPPKFKRIYLLILFYIIVGLFTLKGI